MVVFWLLEGQWDGGAEWLEGVALGVGGLGEDGHRGGAAIDAVGGSFTMRYTTVAVTAARTGAA